MAYFSHFIDQALTAKQKRAMLVCSVIEQFRHTVAIPRRRIEICQRGRMLLLTGVPRSIPMTEAI